MSLGSRNDSGRRPWSVASWFGMASLIPGVVVVIASLWMTGICLGGMRPRGGGGGDPQGGMATGLALEFLGVIGAGIALLGSLLALIGLNGSPQRWGKIGMALNLGCPLLCLCLVTVLGFLMRPPPPALLIIPHTAFFEWCEDNNFGVKSPVVWKTFEHIADKEGRPAYSLGEICSAKLDARTPCKTDDEARKFVEAAVVELQRVAKEKGVSLSAPVWEDLRGLDLRDTPPSRKMEMRYQSGPNLGLLSAEYQPTYTTAYGEPGKKYEILFWLSENYRKQD